MFICKINLMIDTIDFCVGVQTKIWWDSSILSFTNATGYSVQNNR